MKTRAEVSSSIAGKRKKKYVFTRKRKAALAKAQRAARKKNLKRGKNKRGKG